MLHGYKYKVETDLLKGTVPYRFFTNALDVRKYVINLEVGEDNYWAITDKDGKDLVEKYSGEVHYADRTDIPKALRNLQ